MKILFASTYCPLDTTSGAAVNANSLLQGLTDYGFVSESVSASIFDPVREVSLDSMLGGRGAAIRRLSPHLHPLPEGEERDEGAPEGEKACEGAPEGGEEVVEVALGRVKHTILRTASSRRDALTAREEEALVALADKKIRQFGPDLLLTYGGLSAERKIHKLAREYGVPIVFFLANRAYTKAETFSDIDLVIVPSKAVARFYEQKLGIHPRVLYPVMLRERCQAASVDGRYITFINPTARKGAGIFLRLALDSLRHLPAAEYLVVEGRATRDEFARFGVSAEKLPNVTFAGNRADMREIYACTRILLSPSLGGGVFSQVIAEAQLNGIPVIAAARGGVLEALNGGGFVLGVPERCRGDPRIIPTSEEIRPWLDRMRALLTDQEAYEEARRRAYEAGRDLEPESTLSAAARLFEEVMETSKTARAGHMSLSRKICANVIVGPSMPAGGDVFRRKVARPMELSSFTFIVPGVIVPHGRCEPSERLAAKVFGSVHIPDRVIILGPDHSARSAGAAATVKGSWGPGRVPVETVLAQRLLDACPLFTRDDQAHREEPSLEAQVPFLYHLNPRVRIAPILLTDLTLAECLELGEAIARVAGAQEEPVLVVATAQMIRKESRQGMETLAVGRMMALDPRGLYGTIVEARVGMCGHEAATVAMAVCRSLGASQGELVEYVESDAASGDKLMIAGYAGLIFRG